MATKIIKNDNINNFQRFLSCTLGIVLILLIATLDKFYWKTAIIAEGWPDFSPDHLIRSVVIFLAILAFFYGLKGRNNPNLILNYTSKFPLGTVSTLCVLSGSVLIIYLFIFQESIFNALSMEDRPIEWGAAVLLFGSCIATIIACVKSFKKLNVSILFRFSLGFLSLLFFIMAMEEVSWFQRILEFETPEEFDNNLQKEMNLHNFITNQVENTYYFGTFLFLLVAPLILILFPFLIKVDYLEILIPRPFIGVIGSIAYAYNFDMWNIIFTQIAFFGSIVILFLFFLFCRDRKEKYIILLTIFILSVTQALFLTNGDNFARLWQVTEYKEFLISLTLFVYSLDILFQINQKPACFRS